MSRTQRTSLLGAALVLALASCSAPPSRVAVEGAPPGIELAPDWSRSGPETFEAFADAALPEGRETPLSDDAYLDLVDGLAAEPRIAVRAAVLLARSGTPRAAEALLARLEARALGTERESDAGDVVAAAALAELGPEAWTARLASLAIGGRPHPDFEVRVECASSALARGDERVVPFLLAVLRIDTYAGRDDALVPGPFTAWVRTRAAEALSRRAGVPCSYSADASIEDREREARRLEALLAAPRVEGK